MSVFNASNSGASTTNYTDDTAFYYLGGTPFGNWLNITTE